MSDWMARAGPQGILAAQPRRSGSPLVRFAIIFIVILVITLVIVAVLTPSPPASSCPTAPAPCSVPPIQSSTDPAGISAATTSSGRAARSAGHRWLPGTIFVPPLAAVKSVIAHMLARIIRGRGTLKN